MTGLKQTFLTGLTDTSVDDLEGIGQHRYEDGKWYKWVRYEDGTGVVAAVAGNVCYYRQEDFTPPGHADSVVESDLSDSNFVGAGVLQAVIADGSYGWIQIKGLATITTALTAGADGNALTAVGTTDGTLDVVAADTSVIVAYALDASVPIILCDFPW